MVALPQHTHRANCEETTGRALLTSPTAQGGRLHGGHQGRVSSAVSLRTGTEAALPSSLQTGSKDTPSATGPSGNSGHWVDTGQQNCESQTQPVGALPAQSSRPQLARSLCVGRGGRSATPCSQNRGLADLPGAGGREACTHHLNSRCRLNKDGLLGPTSNLRRLTDV